MLSGRALRPHSAPPRTMPRTRHPSRLGESSRSQLCPTVAVRLRGQPHVIVGPVPAGRVDEVYGEIHSSDGAELVAREAYAMPAEGERGGRAVLDPLPPIEPEMEAKWFARLDQQVP